MKPILRLVICSTTWLNLGIVTAHATAAAQAPASDANLPTSIELALADLSCGPQTTDAAHFDCLSARVAALRADFGYDLSRLSSSQRNAIDKSCGQRLTMEGHNAYIACVNTQLRSLPTRKAAPVDATPLAPAATPPQAVSSGESSPRTASSTWPTWLIGFLGMSVVVGGAAVFAMRSKAAKCHCSACGTIVAAATDLCTDCRRQSAEARRVAAAERAEHARALAEGERQLEQAKEQQRAREEAESRLRREHEEQHLRAQREQDARLAEEKSRCGEADAARQVDLAAADDLFDPHVILGLASDAGRDAVVAAYQQARSRYSADAVEFLGDEVQAHYRVKAAAVERAYQMLTGDVASSETAAAQH